MAFTSLSQIWCKYLEPLVRFIHFQITAIGFLLFWILNKFKISSADRVQSGPERHHVEFSCNNSNNCVELAIYKFKKNFKQRPSTILYNRKMKFSKCRCIAKWACVRRIAKFRYDSLNGRWEITSYIFFKPRPLAILGLFYACPEPPTSSTWWFLLLCKIWFRIGCVVLMEDKRVSMLCEFGLKMPFHTYVVGVLGVKMWKRKLFAVLSPKNLTALEGWDCHPVN